MFKMVLIIAIASLIGISAALYYSYEAFFNGKDHIFQNMMAKEGQKFGKDRELSFSDVIVIMDKEISIDGSEPIAVRCSKGMEYIPFGYLQLKNMRLVLGCLDDYMGGIRTLTTGISESLGLHFGDAGQLSDLRTWIRRDKTSGNLLFFKVVQQSHSDAGTKDMPYCTSRLRVLTLDTDQKKFVEVQSDARAEDFKFIPPARIDERCIRSGLKN